MKNGKQLVAVIAMVMMTGTTRAQITPEVSLQLNIKCEAVTEQNEKYLVWASLVKKLNTPEDIFNYYVVPGTYGQFELTAVPLIGGNRSDDAIIENFSEASVSGLKDPQGNQLSASKGKACRMSYNIIHC